MTKYVIQPHAADKRQARQQLPASLKTAPVLAEIVPADQAIGRGAGYPEIDVYIQAASGVIEE